MIHISEAFERTLVTTRTVESPIERALAWRFIRNLNFIYCPVKFDVVGAGWFVFPQYKIDNFRADFLIKAYGFHRLNRIWPPNHIVDVAIECDGKDYHDAKTDAIRDAYFKTKDIETLRFSGSMIHNHPQMCIEHIISYIEGKV